jgi:hypothetical protein
MVILVENGSTWLPETDPPGLGKPRVPRGRKHAAGSRRRQPTPASLARLGAFLCFHRLAEAVTFAVHFEDVAAMREPVQ